MSLRKPLCALCGLSALKGKSGDYLLVTWRSLPGAPRVGWHGECAFTDLVFRQLGRHKDEPTKIERQLLVSKLNEIHERGPGRLVAGVAWNAP